MKKSLFILFLSFSTLFAKQINVAVAANVSYAIEELKKEFHKLNPDIKVKAIIGSSGKLTAMIKHGAPYDLFLSANVIYPQELVKKKIAVCKEEIYAKGRLALFSVKKMDFSRGIRLLKDKDIKMIAIANPKTAPYGKATKEALKNSFLYDELKSKFVYGESISQTLIYALNAADIGLVAKSALFSPKLKRFKKDINWVDVDKNLYTPINQAIVLLDRSDEAKIFYDFILSKRAKEIFKSYGYISD